MRNLNKRSWLQKAALVCAGTMLFCMLTGCRSMSTDTIIVDADGNYAYAEIDDADYYVVRFFKQEDINADGSIKEGCKPVLKQTLQAGSGTTGTFKKVKKLAFGSYVPTIYGLYMDKSTTETVVGETLLIGGTLSTPEIKLQNDYGSIKVSVTDKSFDEHYFEDEKNYSFTAEVYTDASCSGTPVQTVEFGNDAEYIAPTNSSNAIWLRNRSVSIDVDDGTYYVRCKANGNAADDVQDSAWSEVSSITVSAASTEVKYVTFTFDPATGSASASNENMLEFGNGAQMFTNFSLTDDADTVKDGDLYTLNGAANCDLHLMGTAGATSGEAYTCGPRLMPIDKPDIRGEWVTNDDGTITVTLMADYQYYLEDADRKTT